MAVVGFCTPGFKRLDRQMDLVRQLVNGTIVNIENVINERNNDGRTVLHMAVISNVHTDLVELLMKVRSINLNIRDNDGIMPLDILRQHPQSASSEILIKQLISAGGIVNSKEYRARSAIAFHLKMQGTGRSPGTSFRISDAEIFLYTGVEASEASEGLAHARLLVRAKSLTLVRRMKTMGYPIRRNKIPLAMQRGISKFYSGGLIGKGRHLRYTISLEMMNHWNLSRNWSTKNILQLPSDNASPQQYQLSTSSELFLYEVLLQP